MSNAIFIFFDIFISLFCCLLNPGGAKRDIIYHPKLICQMISSKKTQKNCDFFCNFCAQRASACAPCVYECAGGRFCVLDGICDTQVEMVDACLGIMGFMGTVRIMGNAGASLNGSLGLLGRWGDGVVQGWGGSPVARGSGWSRTQVGLVGRVRQVGPAIGKKYYHSGKPTDIACPEAQNLSNT